MNFVCLLCSLLLTAAAPGAAAQYRLHVSPPPSWTDGWKQASDTAGKDWRLVVYVPSDVAQGLGELVSVTGTIRNTSKDQGVKRLVEAWALQLKRTCKRLIVVPGDEALGEEFNVGYAEFYCPKRTDTGMGAVDVVKVIAAGNEARLVAVSRLGPPFRDIAPLAGWVKPAREYLKSEVRLCRGPSPLKQECSP
jgi:hypothetical protein